MTEYLPLPALCDWVDEHLARGPIILRAIPPKTNMLWQLGTLHRESGAIRFWYAPVPFEVDKKSKAVLGALGDWAVGYALTRAGYQRPWIDPASWEQLLMLSLDNDCVVEIIAETSALANGALHFLTDLFQARCRVYLTPVTERELQDLASNNDGKKKAVARAARRFLEQRPPGVVFDTLALENIPMLLSRGPQRGDKNSESDAMNLRLAREKILDRGRGAEPFFVATDTDLIRWATTELPPGRIIAMDALKAQTETWYLPAEWWPGRAETTSNRRMTYTDGGRLLWELLPAFNNGLELSTASGTYRLLAHRPGGKMGPTDYQSPWVRIDSIASVHDQSPTAVATEAIQPDSPPQPNQPIQRPAVQIFFEPDEALTQWPATDVRRRPSVVRLMEALLDVANEGELTAVLETEWTESVRRQVRPVLEALGVARTPNNARLNALRQCVESGDLDQLAHFLRPWSPFAWAAFGDGDENAERMRAVAKKFAEAIGFRWKGNPCTARPDSAAIRTALINAARTGPRISARRLLTDIAGDVLGIGPARFLQHWPLMKAAGVFEGFQFEEGGTGDDEPEIWVVDFSFAGWFWKPISLDAIEGVREFIWKGDPS